MRCSREHARLVRCLDELAHDPLVGHGQTGNEQHETACAKGNDEEDRARQRAKDLSVSSRRHALRILGQAAGSGTGCREPQAY